MHENTPVFEVDPTEENSAFCDCCGQQSRTVWGYVHGTQGTIASYFVQWTVGQTLEDHHANFDLIYGMWGEGASAKDRCAISLVHFADENGPGVCVIDANGRPVATSELVSKAMRRDDVVGTTLAQDVFAIFDAVLLGDKRLNYEW